VVPALIANVGIANRLELVLEGSHHLLLGQKGDVPRARIVDTALNVKAVAHSGELQDESGPSIAPESGVLLPTPQR
jgi:hypothetical protein